MSREKQIEEMADDIRRIRESYYGQADYLFAMKMYEAGYRKQSEGEWISVDDRLPELLQDVLCYRGNFKGDLMNTYTYLGQGMWKDDYGINYSTEEDGITHWMPLPTPPKEDKND